MLLSIGMQDKSKELFNKCVEGKNMLEIFLEPMRQGRLFSPSAAKTESKYTSQTPYESKDRVGEHGTLTRCLVIAFNCRPKVPDGTIKRDFNYLGSKIQSVNTGKPCCRIKVIMAPILYICARK